jgi:hypothetical protein
VKIVLLSIVLLFVASCSDGSRLPSGYELIEDGGLGFSVKNSNGVVILGPGIVSIGFDERYIVGCVFHPLEHRDAKRMVFLSLDRGVGVDTINSANWANFVKRDPGLTKIALRKIADIDCPDNK